MPKPLEICLERLQSFGALVGAPLFGSLLHHAIPGTEMPLTSNQENCSVIYSLLPLYNYLQTLLWLAVRFPNAPRSSLYKYSTEELFQGMTVILLSLNFRMMTQISIWIL